MYNYLKNFSFLIIILLISISVRAQKATEVTIDIKNKAQTIQNFGASGCWFSDPIGKFWPDSIKEHMAALLFSKAIDKKGNIMGIGLSAWRFNIGAGTAEQGDSSGIKDVNRRVECFLNADGTYSWTKEAGYMWFTKKANNYGVENLIAYVNSPPVYYTQNGLGYKTHKSRNTNLKADKYEAYADFLATVLAHFDAEQLHFKYISPVNEPQWEWYNKYGEGTQEGSPYTNAEIYKVVNSLDRSLTEKKLSTKILIPEAGMLTYLYNTPNNSETGSQIQQFWKGGSPFYLGDLKHVSNFMAGHGYFTDVKDSAIIVVRRQVADTAKKYKVEYWQSEYSMLGNGYMEGSKEKRSAIDCAIFLARLIHHDLVDGSASAWQFWNAWEPGSADFNTRYYLLALNPSRDFKTGSFKVTKNLWALGHFSRFARPGMVRIRMKSSADPELLTSAFYGKHQLVMVIINSSTAAKELRLKFRSGRFKQKAKCYVTTASIGEDMKPSDIEIKNSIPVKPRSICTLVLSE